MMHKNLKEKKKFLTLGIDRYRHNCPIGKALDQVRTKISSQPVTMHRSDVQCGLHQKGVKNGSGRWFPAVRDKLTTNDIWFVANMAMGLLAAVTEMIAND